MDTKDLRTETVSGERNDGSKYSQSGAALQCNRNKSYQDIGSNPLAKTDSLVRPCAVIGPGVPPPAPNDAYLKGSVELWPYPDNTYLRPPEYPHKLQNNLNPTRNISPRQTFQENMQRIMVPPTYSAIKHIDESNSSHIQDQNPALSKHSKQNVAPEAKYCDVPYAVLTNDHKTIRETEMCVTSVNSPLTLTTPNGWPPSSNLHHMRTYGAPDIYQYTQYPSCAGPRPPVVPMGRPHRSYQEEAAYVHPDSYYQDASVRFKPYPSVKERYSQPRYEYIGNYSNPFHPPPYAPNKYDIPNTRTPHPYPGYPHLKYVDNRVPDANIEGYQIPNQQTLNHSMQFRNQVVHPNYAPTPGNTQNKVLCYTPNISGKPINKSSFDNKTYIDYENAKVKYPDSYFVNEVARVHQAKNVGVPNYASPSIHAVPMPQYHRKDMPMKPYEYMTHYRHFEHPIGFNSLGHHPPQFSPNTLAISPTDSNTSIDTAQGTSLEDCGYVSQSSTTSVRSVDSANRLSNEFYRRYDYRYRPVFGTSHMLPRPEAHTKTRENKKIDVRQFLSMWNEDEDNSTNASGKEITTPVVASDPISYTKRHEIAAKSQDQLYVLGLVNVPSEELAKYEHIQKISKLPDNIKGYNSIELLNQFEEVIESSNLNTIKSSTIKEYNIAVKDRKSTIKPIVEVMPRPISPLDVEAKISQSVIHKEVGCNFEIKPCSPKMMNVEIAEPVNYLGERVIEKVSNPVSNKPKSPLSMMVDTPRTIQRQESTHSIYESPSCKMVGSPFTTNNIETAKTDYSLQDLETSSGLCLASLPTLDNEIELSFPEVNQQFINANKVDHGFVTQHTQEVTKSNLEPKSSESDTSKKISEEKSKVSHLESTATVVTRLSKYRKTKANPLECTEDESKINATRTDSVIIENPENVRKIEDNNSYNRIMKDCEEYKPVSLTSQSNSHAEIQHNETHDVIESALDFSLSKSDSGLPIISDNCTDLNDITQEKSLMGNNVRMEKNDLNDGNQFNVNRLGDTKQTYSSESVLCETITNSIIVRNECNVKYKDDSTFSSAKVIDKSCDSPNKLEERSVSPTFVNESATSVLTYDNADQTITEIKKNANELNLKENPSSAKVIVLPKNKNDTENKPSKDLIDDFANKLQHDIQQEEEMHSNFSEIDKRSIPDISIQNNNSSEDCIKTDTNQADIISETSSAIEQKYDGTALFESDYVLEKKHEHMHEDAVFVHQTHESKMFENNTDIKSATKTQEDKRNKYYSELITENDTIDKKIYEDSENSQTSHNNLSIQIDNPFNDVPDNSTDLPISADYVTRKSDAITIVEGESIKNEQVLYNEVLKTSKTSTSPGIICHNDLQENKNDESEIKSVVDPVKANLIELASNTLINRTRNDGKVDNFMACANSDAPKVQNGSSTDNERQSILKSNPTVESFLTERTHSIDSGYHSNKSSFVAPEHENVIDVPENLYEDTVFEPFRCSNSVGNDFNESTSDIAISASISSNNEDGPSSMLSINIIKKSNADGSVKTTLEKTLEVKPDSTALIDVNKKMTSARLNNDGMKGEIYDSDEDRLNDQWNSNACCEKTHESISEPVETVDIDGLISRSLKEDHEIKQVISIKRSYRSSKELYSPWIQKLCMYTEGKLRDKLNIHGILPTKRQNYRKLQKHPDECHSVCESDTFQNVGAKSFTEYEAMRSEKHTKFQDTLRGKSSCNYTNANCENNLDHPDLVDNTESNSSCSPKDKEIIPDLENSSITEECNSKVPNKTGEEEISCQYPNNPIISRNRENIFENDIRTLEFNSEVNHKLNGMSKGDQGTNASPLINPRQRLKRSFSDSSLNVRKNRDEDNTNCFNIWPAKRNRIGDFENPIPNNRRNSVNTEENVSFCILIDDNCILTENDEDKICIAELPEDYITEIDTMIDEDNTEAVIELDTSSRDKHFNGVESVILECEEENPLESWVEDIAFSCEVAENVIISAPSSPTETASECEYDEPYNSSCNERNGEYLFGESRSECEAQVEDTIYNTPQREMNKTLLFGQEIAEYCENSDYEAHLQLELSDNSKSSPKYISDFMEQTQTSTDFSLETPEDKENMFVKELSPLRRIDDYLDVSSAENETEDHCLPRNDLESNNLNPICFGEPSLGNAMDDKIKFESSTSSSSIEVSSTTSEVKKTSILLKITNCNGSKVSQIDEIEPNKRPRCKFTEKKGYSASELNFPNRPLITKAAQKYIPPIKESVKKLKVQINLPQQSLLKLKQLKIAKNEAKIQKQNNVVPRAVKKAKPNFDDVLKSIDEVQIKMHKEKSKKVKTTVPKVVIKKNQNGSHYASTTKRDTFNPDLTGRKWQPWVFLEKNHFIDKMAIRNKTKAIFSHRKKTYVLAEKFKKYKSVTSTKFIISQPKSNDSSGKLKYTIRLKHTY